MGQSTNGRTKINFYDHRVQARLFGNPSPQSTWQTSSAPIPGDQSPPLQVVKLRAHSLPPHPLPPPMSSWLLLLLLLMVARGRSRPRIPPTPTPAAPAAGALLVAALADAVHLNGFGERELSGFSMAGLLWGRKTRRTAVEFSIEVAVSGWLVAPLHGFFEWTCAKGQEFERNQRPTIPTARFESLPGLALSFAPVSTIHPFSHLDQNSILTPFVVVCT